MTQKKTIINNIHTIVDTTDEDSQLRLCKEKKIISFSLVNNKIKDVLIR